MIGALIEIPNSNSKITSFRNWINRKLLSRFGYCAVSFYTEFFRAVFNYIVLLKLEKLNKFKLFMS